MFNEFTLTVEMGNEAMQDLADIADALRDIARRLENDETHGAVRDINGNTVGKFEAA